MSDNIIGFLCAAIILLVIGFCIGATWNNSCMEYDAIKVGVGQYSPTTGHFQWNTNR